jgi:TolB protein
MTQVEGAQRALFPAPATMNLIVLAVALFVSGRAHAQESEEAALGTIDVNGSAGAAVPLPKLAVVPLLTSGRADEVVQLVTRGDLTLSGQFDVLDESAAPSGPFLIDIPLDLDAWGKVGAEYVVRVYSRSATGVGSRLVGEAYLTQTSRVPTTPTGAPVTAAPLFTTTIALTEDVRAASHRLVDALLGALTGRPGGFASRMVYVANIGASRRVFELDSDGFDLHAASPSDATALSPSFGPGDVLFYALSRDLSPFRLATTSRGLPAPVQVPGSLMGLAFSADRKQMALIAMDEGVSTVYLESGGKCGSSRRRRWPTTRPSALPASSRTWLAPPCNGFTSIGVRFLHRGSWPQRRCSATLPRGFLCSTR